MVMENNKDESLIPWATLKALGQLISKYNLTEISIGDITLKRESTKFIPNQEVPKRKTLKNKIKDLDLDNEFIKKETMDSILDKDIGFEEWQLGLIPSTFKQ
jgi:heme oxygenase